ncbi:MAG: cytochrome c oxidase accessory protein CcoG [Myxococcaceae bacterium]|nr:cytochrome c oxidase accessory protein CcoG [Myxococcaceae bacterium]MBH2006076.1 cytochrome c oxidase accessory protein CcoG [Myxococcaceae bacterium]
MKSPDKKPNLDRLFILDHRGSRKYVYPADVSGFYQRIKSVLLSLLMLVYFGLPWVKIAGRPAILIDIKARHFYLLGQVFNAQDFFLAFFLASGAAFFLIVLTAFVGRIWCGWLCPQTVFVEGVFRRIERWIEGPAHQRQRLAQAPWTASKIVQKFSKHIIYIFISIFTNYTFLKYFNENKNIILYFLSIFIYFNFYWFREQFCVILCPYGRMQSALQDRDTIHINYDSKRGETRGKARDTTAGDCVDCGRCIAVCPTGIDIRNGLQMECLECANCIDACNAIMNKLGRPLGLIRYDSLRGLETGKRRFLRPRMVGYALAGIAGLAIATTLWLKRPPFNANLLRVQGIPFTLEQGIIRNQFMIHLTNKNNHSAVFQLQNVSENRVQVILPLQTLSLQPLQSFQTPVIVELPIKAYVRGMKTHIRVSDSVSGQSQVLQGTLIGPL